MSLQSAVCGRSFLLVALALFSLVWARSVSAAPVPGLVDGWTASADSMDVWKSALYNAYSTYCEPDEIRDWSCKWCAKQPNTRVIGVVDIELYGTRAFVAVQGNVVFVSFKGTSDIQNWLEDADFVLTKLPWDSVPEGVEVERGFLSSYNTLRTQILNYTNEALNSCRPNCEVQVSGHSLGASQAFLFVADLKLQRNITSRLTTFGCPRTGNGAWGAWYTSTVMPHEGSVRHVHNKDCIPMAPLTQMGYLHVPHEIWQTTENGTYNQKCNDLSTSGVPEEDPKCSTQYGLTSCVINDHTSYLGIQENVFNPCSGSAAGSPCIADGQCSDAGWGSDCCSGRTSHSTSCIKNGVCGCIAKGNWAIKRDDCCSRNCSRSVGCKCD